MEQIDDIRAFIAIVDQGGQAAAARLLGRSVQSIGRSLAALERNLGVQLLRRTTRQSSPTEVGLAYYRDVRAAIDGLDAARREATSQSASPRGVLRIAAPVQFAPAHVVPLVAKFMQRYPHMEVELVTSDRFDDLIGSRLDLAIRIGELPDSELAAKRLGDLRRVVFGSPGYLDRHGRPQHPEDLARHQCLVRTAHDNDAHWPFLDADRPMRIKVAGRFRADSSAAVYAAALQGLGLGFTPLWQIRDLVDSGRLELVLTGFESTKLPIHAVWLAGRGSIVRAKLFTDFAAAYLPFERL